MGSRFGTKAHHVVRRETYGQLLHKGTMDSGYGMKLSLPNPRQYSGICLELIKNQEKLQYG
jgi:hypothetical protein